MKEKFTVWDPADYIKTPEDVFAHIEVALEENEPKFFSDTLKDIARSNGLTLLAKELGKPREEVCRLLEAIGTLSSMGFQLTVKPSTPIKPKRVRTVSKMSRNTPPRNRIASGKRTVKAKD